MQAAAATDPTIQLLQDPRVIIPLTLGGLYAGIAMIKALADLVARLVSAIRPAAPAMPAEVNGNVNQLLLKQLHEMGGDSNKALQALTVAINNQTQAMQRHELILVGLTERLVAESKKGPGFQ